MNQGPEPPNLSNQPCVGDRPFDGRDFMRSEDGRFGAVLLLGGQMRAGADLHHVADHLAHEDGFPHRRLHRIDWPPIGCRGDPHSDFLGPDHAQAVVRDQKVLTIDYEAASAALEEAQARGLSQIRQLDWAGRNAEEIAGSAFPRR